MEKRDLYEVLGVARGTSSDEITKAYRRLALEHHPDVNPDDASAEDRFKEISFAKEVLLDDDKRRLYDEFGFDGLAPGFDAEQSRSYREWAKRAERSASGGFRGFGGGPGRGGPGAGFDTGNAGGIDLDDLLGELFRAQGGGGGARPRRGMDLESDLDIDFLDAVRGAELRLQLAATGGRPARTLRVRVPAGASDGNRIRLAGQGLAAEPDGAAGDLYVRLHVRPHAFFTRHGDDLHVEVPATLPELILGAEIDVPTPEGSVQMKIPAGSVNGQRLRLRGKGVRKGDLMVRLTVAMPEGGGERLSEIAHELEALYADRDVRAHLRPKAEKAKKARKAKQAKQADKADKPDA